MDDVTVLFGKGMLKELLNKCDADGKNALHHAIYNDNPKAIGVLLNGIKQHAGADTFSYKEPTKAERISYISSL